MGKAQWLKTYVEITAAKKKNYAYFQNTKCEKEVLQKFCVSLIYEDVSEATLVI